MPASASPSPTAGVPTSDTDQARRRKGTLLIVDDEEGPRMSLYFVFKDDYDCILASDGATAIEIAQKNRVDVAVLDIRMAGMSGSPRR